jgi:hypothetical protein
MERVRLYFLPTCRESFEIRLYRVAMPWTGLVSRLALDAVLGALVDLIEAIGGCRLTQLPFRDPKRSINRSASRSRSSVLNRS